MNRVCLRLVSVLALALALSGEVVAAGDSGPGASPPPEKKSAGPWDTLLQQGIRAGVPRKRMAVLIARLSRAAVPPDVGREMLLPAFDAARAGLPEEAVLAKVEEGLLKSVPPDAITAATRNRYESLRRAHAILSEAWGPAQARRAPGLLTSIALAMESGTPEPSLKWILQRGRGKPSSLVGSVVEAGEALHLAGFEPEAVEAIMGDCLDRNLRRQELLRVVRFASERKRSGASSGEVRESLWGRRATGPRSDPKAPGP